MRIIICGAGEVGYAIASYLAGDGNDVTVVDTDPGITAHINNMLDANAVTGHAADPEVLQHAGIRDAELIIAVTRIDEVNMVACQVAHSLFGVPKTIARIRSRSYRDPAWANLFSRDHMPIDVIISPEAEVASAINRRLRVPGTTNVIPLAEGRVYAAGVLCTEDCPLVNTQIKQIGALFPDLPIRMALIMRGADVIVPGENDQIFAGDEAYFFVDSEHLPRALAAFGHEEREARQMVIVGGGNVGLYLAEFLKEDHRAARLKIIERNMDRARFLGETMEDIVVLQGNALQQEIMVEAGVAQAETLIAVTNDDETNILVSLLAKHRGCERVVTLVSKSAYTPFITALGIDAVVSPRVSTVSSIMRHVRRGRVEALYTLRDGCAEVLETEVPPSAAAVGKAIGDLKLPDGVVIGAVIRGEEVVTPGPDFKILAEDHVILLALREQMRKVEKLFSVRVGFLEG